jgi:transposase
VWRQNTEQAAPPRAKLSRHAVLFALKSLVIDRLSIARIAALLAASWHTVNDAVLAAGRELLIDDPTRFHGVAVIGVDEHAWRHTRRGDKFVTVIIDLTPVREKTGPARLLDMVEGRSKAVFKTWLDAQSAAFREGIEVVAMDGFTGFKTAAAETIPEAVAVMDPFHVVALAGDALDRCRQRVQQDTTGHRGRRGDPLYGIRRVLRTGAELLTDRQKARLTLVLNDDAHVEVEATWLIYQRIRRRLPRPRPGRRQDSAHRDHRRAAGRCPKAPTRADPPRSNTEPSRR